MNEKELFEKIALGREFQITYGTTGFQKVYLGHLKAMLESADKKCHDFKLREDRGKYAIVEYNTIQKIMNISKDIIQDFENAINYCEIHNIEIK